MKIIVRPVVDPQAEIDVTHRLVSAIAHELWSINGGNQQLNWLEAERHLQRLVGEARDEAYETTFVSVAGSCWAEGFGQPGDGQSSFEEERRPRGRAGGPRRRAGQGPRRSSTKAGVDAAQRLAAVGC